MAFSYLGERGGGQISYAALHAADIIFIVTDLQQRIGSVKEKIQSQAPQFHYLKDWGRHTPSSDTAAYGRQTLRGFIMGVWRGVGCEMCLATNRVSELSFCCLAVERSAGSEFLCLFNVADDCSHINRLGFMTVLKSEAFFWSERHQTSLRMTAFRATSWWAPLKTLSGMRCRQCFTIDYKCFIVDHFTFITSQYKVNRRPIKLFTHLTLRLRDAKYKTPTELQTSLSHGSKMTNDHNGFSSI